MRRLAVIFAIFAGSAVLATTAVGEEEEHTYVLEMYNAFGLVDGSEVKVSGVNAGVVDKLEISESKTALITVKLTGPLAVLGDETECFSEPQSLIAEYFINCAPAGQPLEDGDVLPEKVRQTVQNDLVLNALRMPFKQRLAILINEFGTALAGNPENLNEAIRLGAPALEDLHDALKLLAKQNTTIRDLNVNSDEIIGKLADRRQDVVAFIREAGDTAVASAERRDDLSANFDKLDDFLTELGPTMAALEDTATEATPLLADLRQSAPQLNELATSLPAFNQVTQRSLETLGRAAKPGTRALKQGVRRGTFEALANAGIKAPQTSERVKDLLTDIDDPNRIVEIDDRADRECDDKTLPCYATGRTGPTGYTGMEGLLNYLYYQGGALNSFDETGHLLHFQLYTIFQGPCGDFRAEQNFPAEGGGTTNNLLNAENCVGGLGPTQPGINETEESICAQAPAGQACDPMYDPAACSAPNASGSLNLDECVPAGPRRAVSNQSSGGGNGGGGDGTDGGDDGPGLPGGPDLPVDPGDLPDNLDLDDILDLPGNDLDGLLGGKKGKNGGKKGGGGNGGPGQATEDLLDFLFAP